MKLERLRDHIPFFAENESSVRYYCRRVPALFRSASGATIVDAAGRSYTDLMSACGALNTGTIMLVSKRRRSNISLETV